ncbi:hypothetical protein Xmau_03672 [Xenorhabdus mauleonii]|uniref:Uncharacterized protein n=1 Tax=Xenorhabdus mauleonii TaxID=351675 RepID=A0A1I3URZ6_9GAMM|nr:hypothetical protein Xmau_03672 [Xenorhabdus mauleonii]SFJ86114.1 hypothetical protein SAMN05421680_11825 [Xenorhabdus mauleonii]
MNTNRDDINKAAGKILLGFKRINRFVDNYLPYLSEKDKKAIKDQINLLNDKLKS